MSWDLCLWHLRLVPTKNCTAWHCHDLLPSIPGPAAISFMGSWDVVNVAFEGEQVHQYVKQTSNSKALISLKLTLNTSMKIHKLSFTLCHQCTNKRTAAPTWNAPGIRPTATMDDFYFLTVLYLLKHLFLGIAAIRSASKLMVVLVCHLHVCCSFMSLKSHLFVKTGGRGANPTPILIHFVKSVLRKCLLNQP